MARNEDGSPAANAEVSLGIVDEAIYSIASETAGNIKRDFYGRRYNEVQTSPPSTTRSRVMRQPGGFSQEQIGLSTRGFQKREFAGRADCTKEFGDTAFWQPDVVTVATAKPPSNLNCRTI